MNRAPTMPPSSERFLSQRRPGFTLMELVIVVLVLGIITAVAAPKIFNTTNDARDNATRHSLNVLRDAIELHRSEKSVYPAAATLTVELQEKLQGQFPAVQSGANKGDATVVGTNQSPITTPVAGGAGWVYNETTGELRVNDADYIAW